MSTLTGDALDALISELEGDDDDGGRAFKRFIILLALVSAAGAVCTGCRGGLFSLIGVRINVRIRDLLFRHLLALELAYYDVTPTGDLNSRPAAYDASASVARQSSARASGAIPRQASRDIPRRA